MFPRCQFSTESLSHDPAVTSHDGPNLWRDVTGLALALSRKIDRPNHESSVAGNLGAFLRGHLRSVSNTKLHRNVTVVVSKVEMSFIIREANPETDWLTGIWPILQEVVRAGDTFVFAPDIDEAGARQQWMLAPPARVFVAVKESDGTIIGSSFVKANQPSLGGHVANAGFMVAAHAAGNGVGRALAEHSIEWAREAGFSAMQFNFVVSTNSRAIALWKNLGFSIVGTLPQAFQHQGLGRKVDVFVMHRFL